jgi:hypothetical protein
MAIATRQAGKYFIEQLVGPIRGKLVKWSRIEIRIGVIIGALQLFENLPEEIN